MVARSKRSTAQSNPPVSETPETDDKKSSKGVETAAITPPISEGDISSKEKEKAPKKAPKKSVAPKGVKGEVAPTMEAPPSPPESKDPPSSKKKSEAASKAASKATPPKKASPKVVEAKETPSPKAIKEPSSKATTAKAVKVEKSKTVKGMVLPAPRPSRTLPLRAPTGGLPLRTIIPPKVLTLEERAKKVEDRLALTSEEFRRAYQERLDMSWVFHDAALEGVVYTEQELRLGLDPSVPAVPDSSMQPACEEIRRYKEVLLHTKDLATKKRQPVTADTIKKMYLILHPDEGDLKSVKYRKEIPQHRLYFHEYSPPDKIGSKIRQVVDWVNDPETKKGRNTIRIAGRAHFDLLRTFPFPVDSGRVARLFMNMLLMRAGYPPAIIHSTDRQRYYEALKGSAQIVNNMVQEAIENALASTEKILDEYETRVRTLL